MNQTISPSWNGEAMHMCAAESQVLRECGVHMGAVRCRYPPGLGPAARLISLAALLFSRGRSITLTQQLHTGLRIPKLLEFSPISD